MTTDIAVNSPVQLEDTTEPQETTTELSVYVRSLWTSGPVLGAFLIGMCIFGFAANLVMLISLLVYRKVARKTVNTFICNQTTLDLVTTLFWSVKLVLLATGYFETKTGILRIFMTNFALDGFSGLTFLFHTVRYMQSRP